MFLYIVKVCCRDNCIDSVPHAAHISKSDYWSQFHVLLFCFLSFSFGFLRARREVSLAILKTEMGIHTKHSRRYGTVFYCSWPVHRPLENFWGWGKGYRPNT